MDFIPCAILKIRMSKTKEPSKKALIETTRIIFLASCTLIFIFTIFITALIKFQPQEKQPAGNNKNKCIVSGCNGEICQGKDEEPIMTICIYQPEYECYKKAVCEVQEDGKCGWTETKEFQECINNLQE